MEIRAVFLIMLLSVFWSDMAQADQVMTPDGAAQKVELRNLQLKGNAI